MISQCGNTFKNMQGAATQEAADAVMLQVCTAVAAVLTGGTPDPACLVT